MLSITRILDESEWQDSPRSESHERLPDLSVPFKAQTCSATPKLPQHHSPSPEFGGPFDDDDDDDEELFQFIRSPSAASFHDDLACDKQDWSQRNVVPYRDITDRQDLAASASAAVHTSRVGSTDGTNDSSVAKALSHRSPSSDLVESKSKQAIPQLVPPSRNDGAKSPVRLRLRPPKPPPVISIRLNLRPESHDILRKTQRRRR